MALASYELGCAILNAVAEVRAPTPYMGGSTSSDPGKSAEFTKPLQQIAVSLLAYTDQLTAAMDFGLSKWLREDVCDHALGDVHGLRDILLAWPPWFPESVAKDWGHGIYIFENRVASGVATDSAFLRAPPL